MILKMKINWKKALDTIEIILMVLGFIFLTVLVHELVHMIDGYSDSDSSTGKGWLL